MARLPGKSFWLSNCRHSLILLPCILQPPASSEGWSEVPGSPRKWLAHQGLRHGVLSLQSRVWAQT